MFYHYLLSGATKLEAQQKKDDFAMIAAINSAAKKQGWTEDKRIQALGHLTASKQVAPATTNNCAMAAAINFAAKKEGWSEKKRAEALEHLTAY